MPPSRRGELRAPARRLRGSSPGTAAAAPPPRLKTLPRFLRANRGRGKSGTALLRPGCSPRPHPQGEVGRAPQGSFPRQGGSEGKAAPDAASRHGPWAPRSPLGGGAPRGPGFAMAARRSGPRLTGSRPPGAAREGPALAFPSAAGRAPPAGGPQVCAERGGAPFVLRPERRSRAVGPSRGAAAVERRRCAPFSSTCPGAASAGPAMGLRREAAAPPPAARAAGAGGRA